MVMVDITNNEYKAAKKIVESDKVKYPTIRAYVSMAVREKNKREDKNV